MSYIAAEDIAKAKEMDLLTYLRNYEPQEGQTVDIGSHPYVLAVKEAGLRIKLILGTIMGVPDWYLAKYPGSKMKNNIGVDSLGTPCYFVPHQREDFCRALNGMMASMAQSGVLDVVDTLVVDCGPAGEPLYPPAWTQQADGLDNPSFDEYFWGYDTYSQQNFRESMQEKYGTIAAANAAWGKSYGSFDQVEVPKPGNGGGGIWEDYLYWYRDAKRDFVTAQVELYQKLVNEYSDGRIKLILYIPGSDTTDEVFQQAVESGDGGGGVRVMADSRFLIDTAKKYGLYLQYTGFENASQTKYLRDYMDASGAGDIPFFGENAGGYDAVKNGATLVNIIRQNGMAGIDVTHSRWLFDNNTVQPSKAFDRFKKSMDKLINYLQPRG